MKVQSFEKQVEAAKAAELKQKVETAKAAELKQKVEQNAKKEIAQQESLFADKLSKAAAIKSEKKNIFGVDSWIDTFKDKNGNILFTKMTTKYSPTVTYGYEDNENGRIVYFIDKDNDGNMDEIVIQNITDGGKTGDVWSIQGYDNNDDGTFDTALGNLIGLGFDTCKLH